MSKSLMQSTQVNIILSVQISTDREAELLNLVWLLVAPLLFIYQVGHYLNQVRYRLRLWVIDTKDLLSFVSKVLVIIVHSFAFGVLGVRL